MDAYREIDNTHEDEAEAYYEQECFVYDFTLKMLATGEAEFDGETWSIQGDIIPSMDSDVIGEFMAIIFTEGDQEIIDKSKAKMYCLITDAANKLAVELWQGRNEV